MLYQLQSKLGLQCASNKLNLSIFRFFNFCAEYLYISMFLIKIDGYKRLSTGIRLILLVLASVIFFSAGQGRAEPVTFTHDKNLKSDDGYILLSWNNTSQISVELQQASQPTFEHANTLYRGRNSSVMLSGLPDGTYYYRIRTSASEWSDQVTLRVSHYPVTQALLLFVLGALIFLSIAWVVIRGASDES